MPLPKEPTPPRILVLWLLVLWLLVLWLLVLWLFEPNVHP